MIVVMNILLETIRGSLIMYFQNILENNIKIYYRYIKSYTR